MEKKSDFVGFSKTISRKNGRFCGEGGGGGGWGGGNCLSGASAKTTTPETSTTYKCCLFKTGDFVLKTPACFAILFGLGIVSQSEIIICSFNINELRDGGVDC